MTLLEVRDIHTYYGDSYVLQGLSLTLSQGSDPWSARPQRRGEDDIGQFNRRVHAATARQHHLQGHRRHPDVIFCDGAPGHGAGATGPTGLPQP